MSVLVNCDDILVPRDPGLHDVPSHSSEQGVSSLTWGRSDQMAARRETSHVRSAVERDRILIFAVKILILFWGFFGVLLGAAHSVNSLDDSFANRRGIFILLVYGSVEVCSLIAFLSSRISAALLAVSAISAVLLVVLSRSSGHPMSLPDSWIMDVATRPVLCALLLYAVSRAEKAAS